MWKCFKTNKSQCLFGVLLVCFLYPFLYKLLRMQQKHLNFTTHVLICIHKIVASGCLHSFRTLFAYWQQQQITLLSQFLSHFLHFKIHFSFLHFIHYFSGTLYSSFAPQYRFLQIHLLAPSKENGNRLTLRLNSFLSTYPLRITKCTFQN